MPNGSEKVCMMCQIQIFDFDNTRTTTEKVLTCQNHPASASNQPSHCESIDQQKTKLLPMKSSNNNVTVKACRTHRQVNLPLPLQFKTRPRNIIKLLQRDLHLRVDMKVSIIDGRAASSIQLSIQPVKNADEQFFLLRGVHYH